MQTVRKSLAELHKTDKNIRRHSERQIQEYIRSLKMFGQIRPLVATEDGEILIGNGMFEAMKTMGWEKCDAYIISGLSTAQKRKLMLADNKVYEMGFTDVSILEDILSEMNGDFDIPGYDSGLLDTIMSTPAEISESVSKYGVFEDAPVEPKKADVVLFSDAKDNLYQPPVQAANGAFISPNEDAAPQAAVEQKRKFIVCPHCGEKIWL